LIKALRYQRQGEGQPPAFIRWSAAQSLGDLHAGRAVTALVVALGDQDDAVRAQAAEALGKIGDRYAVPPLIACLRDLNRDKNVRIYAALALGQLGDALAVEPLKAALDRDPDQFVSFAAAQALERLGVPGALARAESRRLGAELRADGGNSHERAEPAAEPALSRPAETPEPAVAAAPDSPESISAISGLVDDDHETRKKAINAVSSRGDRDPEETRSFGILGDPQGMSTADHEANCRAYPDFDIAYVRVAYPTQRSDDHAHADVTVLLNSLGQCRRKALLLAQLSSYYTWSGDVLKALDFATASVLLGDPSLGPGAPVQALDLLIAAFSAIGLDRDAETARRVKAPFVLGPTEAAAVAKAASVLAAHHEPEVRWAADAVRRRLAETSPRTRS